MTEVFVVTKGKYSDYSVYGIFVDKNVAEEYAHQLSDKYDTARVEVRPILTKANLHAPIGFRGYHVVMDENGDSTVQREEIRENFETFGYPQVDYKNGEFFHTGLYELCVMTDKGESGAVKIANERRIQLIQQGIWPKKGEVVPE